MELVNTVRFINQFTTGYGNYTEEREQLFANLSLDDVVLEVEVRVISRANTQVRPYVKIL